MDELIFAGNKYISSKRAGQLAGYTTDYLGQLCRGGKMDCRLVGRNWYINERAITAQKKGFKRRQEEEAKEIRYKKIELEPMYYSSDERSNYPEINKVVHKNQEEVEDEQIIEIEDKQTDDEQDEKQAVQVHAVERPAVNLRDPQRLAQKLERQIVRRRPIVPQQINKGFPIAASIASVLILIGILFTAGTFTLEQAIHYSSANEESIDTKFQFASVQRFFNLNIAE